MKIREVQSKDKTWIKNLLVERWGSPLIVSQRKLYNALELPGFIAEINDKPIGLLTYNLQGNQCEIITFDSIEKGKGVGSKLLELLINKGREKWKRIWLITTNDNLEAQKFYKNRGFKIVAVHENAIEESRKLKPEIPLIGENGIPVKDEIEFELEIKD